MTVFVLGRDKRPLMPCSEKRARQLLERGRARVHRMAPFAIRLVDRTVAGSVVEPLAVKLDPGSVTTGMALARVDGRDVTHVLQAFEVAHRGRRIREALSQRAQCRRRRRGNLRFRPKRFDNRRRPEGWLPPSLRHRIDTTLSWVGRLRRLAPVGSVDMELVRFDTALMQDPDVSGVGYQHGTLHGFEVREYVLQHWGHRCAYCDASGCPLEVEHVVARAKSGSDRVSNLALACVPCNRAKGARDVSEFLAGQPERLKRVLAHLKAPLRDAAMMNATRFALRDGLAATGLPVRCHSGGLTKFNRKRLGVPKTHANDAACVGRVSVVEGWWKPGTAVRCTGRGAYGRTRVDANGFPRGYLTRTKRVFGFATGDLVVATIPPAALGKLARKNVGTWRGRVAVRAGGTFVVQVRGRADVDVRHTRCRLLQRADGYGYGILSRQDRPEGSAAIGAPPGPGWPGSRTGRN